MPILYVTIADQNIKISVHMWKLILYELIVLENTPTDHDSILELEY